MARCYAYVVEEYLHTVVIELSSAPQLFVKSQSFKTREDTSILILTEESCQLVSAFWNTYFY